MENLYIQIENNQPVNHPVTGENLIHVHGLIPSNWVPFIRIPEPDHLTSSQTQKGVCTYTLSSDGVSWQDTWSAVDLTLEEMQNKIAPLFPNAIYNFTTQKWDKPPKPTDGQNYLFNFTTGIWTVVPVKPTDGKNYTFDWQSMTWVVVPATT